MKCSVKDCNNTNVQKTSLNLTYCKKHKEQVMDIIKQTNNYIKIHEKDYLDHPNNKFINEY